ncbi:MAG: hypothetical protein Kow0099_02330 [Candidatus Abyssubacteria bacterium]
MVSRFKRNGLTKKPLDVHSLKGFGILPCEETTFTVEGEVYNFIVTVSPAMHRRLLSRVPLGRGGN